VTLISCSSASCCFSADWAGCAPAVRAVNANQSPVPAGDGSHINDHTSSRSLHCHNPHHNRLMDQDLVCLLDLPGNCLYKLFFFQLSPSSFSFTHHQQQLQSSIINHQSSDFHQAFIRLSSVLGLSSTFINLSSIFHRPFINLFGITLFSSESPSTSPSTATPSSFDHLQHQPSSRLFPIYVFTMIMEHTYTVNSSTIIPKYLD
jgi:hypothetical protein